MKKVIFLLLYTLVIKMDATAMAVTPTSINYTVTFPEAQAHNVNIENEPQQLKAKNCRC